jgi:hypothetical protein
MTTMASFAVKSTVLFAHSSYGCRFKETSRSDAWMAILPEDTVSMSVIGYFGSA